MSTIELATFEPEFDHLYRMNEDGTIVDPRDGEYLPDVEHSPGHDVLVDYTPRTEAKYNEWDVLIGHTGQYSYQGAVMHPSELWGQWAIDDLTSKIDEDVDWSDPNPPKDHIVSAVHFGIVEVRDEDGSYPEGDPIGWAVVFKRVFYTKHTWQTATFTGTMTCATCRLLPLDNDDMQTPCPGYFDNDHA